MQYLCSWAPGVGYELLWVKYGMICEIRKRRLVSHLAPPVALSTLKVSVKPGLAQIILLAFPIFNSRIKTLMVTSNIFMRNLHVSAFRIQRQGQINEWVV